MTQLASSLIFTNLERFGIPTWTLELLVLLSLFLIAKKILGILYGFFVYFLRPGKNLKRYGKWTIVTGCTDGIGKAIAESFARKGLNLVLISRTPAKLEEQAKELQSKYNIETRVVPLDFSLSSPNLYDGVRNAVRDLDIGILVNNVGMSYDHADFFENLTEDKIDKLIRLNIYSTTTMTSIVLPGMLQRKRGAIINVSSLSATVNEPMYAVYAASKAFVNTFSQALYYECKGRGVDVQTQLPAFVTTKMSKLRQTSFFVCSTSAYAKAFCAHIGYGAFVVSWWTHALQMGALKYIPQSIIAMFLLSRGKDIRRRALAKKAQQQKQE